MSKTWHMKKRILRTLSKQPRTSGEIAKILELAPSTVSVHIAELEKMGAIEKIENGYAKRWKYYKIKKGFDVKKAGRIKEVNIIPLMFFGIAIAAVIGVASFMLLMHPGARQTPILTVRLTDPPHVPNGTQALLVSYSALQVHIRNNTGWITSNTTGIANLMSLTNMSEMIGKLKVPANAAVDQVRFNITSARIVINGKTYNVETPNLQLSTNVLGGSGLSNNITVLIDMKTTVANTSNAAYTLTASLNAITLNNTNTNEQIGSVDQLNVSVEDELNKVGGSNSTNS